jgi:hypothetical protein
MESTNDSHFRTVHDLAFPLTLDVIQVFFSAMDVHQGIESKECRQRGRSWWSEEKWAFGSSTDA